MEARETIRKIAALPPDAQAVIFDLIATLEKRYSSFTSKTKVGKQMAGLKDDPFVGMWRDRDEMSDSESYVRNLRQSEWTRASKKA